MAKRLVMAIVTAGVVAGGVSVGIAYAGGPSGTVAEDISVAVGTGTFEDFADGVGGLMDEAGFTATGPTNEAASASVIAACQAAGGVECTADEVTNDNLCIVSVASDLTGVVSGGAGPTIEAATQDALSRAAAAGTPEGDDAVVLVSDCP